MKKRTIENTRKLDRIFTQEQSELHKLAEGFHFITRISLTEYAREMELMQALGDHDQMIKEQIKHSTMQHVVAIFDECYQRATGKSWHAEETSDE